MINYEEVLSEYKKLREYILPYVENSIEIRENLKNSAVRKEYSVKGGCIHRGFYCPSPTLDIVVGNCNRGKLLKRLTSRSKPSHIYYYNENDKIMLVEKPHRLGTDYELLLYADNTVMSAGFDQLNELRYYTKCVYNGERILSYDYYTNLDYRENTDTHFLGHEYYEADKCVFYKGEKYHYTNEGFKSVDMDTVMVIFKGIESINRNTYTFKHDSEGYLSAYTAEHRWFTQGKKHSVSDHEYQVYVRRKV